MNIPPAHRFNEPSAYGASSNHLQTMRDLIPEPLRRSRSPSRPQTSDGRPSLWEHRSEGRGVGFRRPTIQRVDGPRMARSVSPVYVSPLHDRPFDGPSPPSLQTRPVPRQYLTAQEVERLPSSRRAPPRDYLTAEQVERLPSSRRPAPQTTRSRPELPTLEPLSTRPVPPRKGRAHIPSMIDYLTLEQLEGVWQKQDSYKGVLDVPQKPATPISLIAEETDEYSPIYHPAFRRQRHPFNAKKNSFAVS